MLRRLLFITILVIFALPAAAQTTTFNGTVRDLTGAPVPTGQVSFALRPGIDTTTSGSARFVPTTIFCEIHNPSIVSTSGTGTIASPYIITGVNSTTSFNFTLSGTHTNGAGGTAGGLYKSSGTGSCMVTQNTALTPANTYYSVSLWPIFSLTSTFNTYAIGLGPVDISTIVPTPGQQPAYSFVDLFSTQTITGTKTFTNATLNITGPFTFQGDVLAKSGRPWYDVMAFGARNNGAIDDTVTIQAAYTAACTNGGGTVYFPPATAAGSFYLVSPQGGATNPAITIGCSAVTTEGAAYTVLNSAPTPPSNVKCPTCNGPVFGVSAGQKFGLRFDYIGISSGGVSNTGSQGINLGNSGSSYIEGVFFDNAGDSCLKTTGGAGMILIGNWAQDCLLARPSVDEGGFDFSTSDVQMFGNFVTAGGVVGNGAGQIGNGHSYAAVFRGLANNGSIVGNYFDQSQHGLLNLASQMRFVGNRFYQNQGNALNVQSGGSVYDANMFFSSSQTADNTYSDVVVSGSQNVFSNNVCTANPTDTRQALNCFDDSNSLGTTEREANYYSHNKLTTSSIRGVIYNMTGLAPYSIQQPHRQSNDRGDTSVTVQCGLDAETQVFLTPLTANRTITFSTTGAWQGCRFRVTRDLASTGASTLATVAGNADVTLATGQSIDLEYSGGLWRIINAATLVNEPNLLISPTAPTISSGFGTSPSITATNGTASFFIVIGTTPGSTGVIGLPATANGWNCWANNQNRSAFIGQSAGTTTSATLTNYGTTFAATNFTAADTLLVSCFGR